MRIQRTPYFATLRIHQLINFNFRRRLTYALVRQLSIAIKGLWLIYLSFHLKLSRDIRALLRGPHACRLIPGKRNDIFSSASHEARSRNSTPTRMHKFLMAPWEEPREPPARPLSAGDQTCGITSVCATRMLFQAHTEPGHTDIPIPEHVKEETTFTCRSWSRELLVEGDPMIILHPQTGVSIQMSTGIVVPPRISTSASCRTGPPTALNFDAC